MFVYLDNSATTKQYEEVTAAMIKYMAEDYGNPSSLHRLGFTAEKAVRTARKAVAAGLGAKEEEICFTSGGTEADNEALLGAAEAKKRRGNKIITTKVEHPAVLENCKRLEKMGYCVEYIPVDGQCRIDLPRLEAAIDSDTILISVMQVNNEAGTILPVEEIARYKNEYNKAHGTEILLHTDAVQAFGKIKTDFSGADLVSVSAHKIHGPKGMGALYIKGGVNLAVYMAGGGQERNRRSGTENVPGIVGFGKAADISFAKLEERSLKMEAARKYLLTGIMAEMTDIRINSPKESDLAGKAGFCCPSVLNVSFLGTRGEVILHALEQAEIYVSTGSACASNKKGQSHVLAAMGLCPKEIEGAIRFSFNEFNTIDEMDYVLVKLKEAVSKFRKLGSFR